MKQETYLVQSCSTCPFSLYNDDNGIYRCYQYSNENGSVESCNISSSFVIGTTFKQVQTVHENCPLKNKSITIKLS
jgi:hypothetical protein